MSCVAAPPSDHATNPYVLPPTVCVGGAPTERTAPSTPTKDDPSANGAPSSRSPSPSTFDASVTLLVRGRTSRVAVWVRPCASLTVRWIRYHWSGSNSPAVGTRKAPPFTPSTG